MLEHRVLLLSSHTGSALQPIVDADNGAALGYARWEPRTGRTWWPMFRRGVLAVHEQEDEPLLFTVHRAWSLLPRRDVRDAEGQAVGSLQGRLIHDRYGRPLAARDNGVFRDRFHHVLAELTPSAQGLRLAFSEDIAGEPFLKMLLLAAVLCGVA